MNRERPAVTKVVAWAAGNGDRSENADYLYGKRRLRQIDSRIRFLTKRIDAAEIVDPAAPRSGSAATRVFFGATVTYKVLPSSLRPASPKLAIDSPERRRVCIVGIDEVDLSRRHISWVSPLARASLSRPRAVAWSCARQRIPNTSKILDFEYAAIRWSRTATRQAPKRPTADSS